MSHYMVVDFETQNHKSYRRFANPFDNRNYVVARGWKIQGDPCCSWHYAEGKDYAGHTHIPAHVSLLVGHNIKFDLLYEWGINPDLTAFFKRGGEIWDTQYAEYLINAAHPEYHMVSLDSIVEKYGGRKKIDAVKELWKQGVLTADIDKHMLIDYLVGTEEENRNSGDIGNTELVFLGQVKRAKELNMLTTIRARMDGLLCTTEMEYNGLFIDVAEAKRRTEELERELADVDSKLAEFIPELPEGLEFNWSSPYHVSALIFGGLLAYTKSDVYYNEDGKLVCSKAKEKWFLHNRTPMPPDWWADQPGTVQPDVYTSGAKKGEDKFKWVDVPGPPKTKMQTFTFALPGYTKPKESWKTELKHKDGTPVYQTGDDIIEELGQRDIPFLKYMAKRQEIVKDLGTYYVRYDTKKDEFTGMLMCIHPDTGLIHHSLNHTATVTTRLSSSDPNLQNIPRADTSQVKKMFKSRYANGKMMEADYSQLEIIGQALLTGDRQLIADIISRVDFHCKRVSAKCGISYEDAVDWCKNDQHPDYKNGKNERTKCKVFSFQRAYGAGAAKISLTTGIPENEVKQLIEIEEAMYPGIVKFNAMVEEAVAKSATMFTDPIRGYKTYRRGYYQVPTGTIFTWRSYDAPSFLQKKGISETFKPTELKNYPVQGICGEIVQIILGLLWRHFLNKNNYNGQALLCNQVHDSVWFDCHADVVEEVARDVKRIMESVPEVLNRLFDMIVPVPFPAEIEIGNNLYEKKVLHIT